jgi:hypothetical protein
MCQKKLLPLVLLTVLGCLGAEGSPFSRWAVRGVVVNKTYRATPLSHSLGVDGIYKLEVRDADHKVRRQMVTRALFLAYEIGDAFDPDGAPPTVAERARRLAAIAAKEKARAEVEEALAADFREPKGKLIVAAFPQDMLPETEGF